MHGGMPLNTIMPENFVHFLVSFLFLTVTLAIIGALAYILTTKVFNEDMLP